LPGLSREVDLEAIDAYLALQYVPGNGTALRGIRKVPPGHLLVAEGDSEQLACYWQAAPAEPSATDDEWLERVRATVA
jgi:asparagine synthase (glutamine-hydrolysing)